MCKGIIVFSLGVKMEMRYRKIEFFLSLWYHSMIGFLTAVRIEVI